jgi:tRNA1(Val) A37 N6-methylase TrmN6
MGNFPIAIYIRLMNCLKILIPDEELRRKHILQNMLYMVELDEPNVFMMKKILCGNKYKLNVFQGSFIDGNYNKIFQGIFDNKSLSINTFDIIIGNPPYNKGGISSNKKKILFTTIKKRLYVLISLKSLSHYLKCQVIYYLLIL